MIPVGVLLPRIARARAIVAGVPHPVAVTVGLGGIGHGRAVVGRAEVRGEARVAVAVRVGVGARVVAVGDPVTVGIGEGPPVPEDRQAARSFEDGQILPPVAVQVGHHQRLREWTGPVSLLRPERAVPDPGQEGDVRGRDVGQREIGHPIVVQVGDDHLDRLAPRVVVRSGDKRSISVSVQDGHDVALHLTDRQIEPAVTVEVAFRDGIELGEEALGREGINLGQLERSVPPSQRHGGPCG